MGVGGQRHAPAASPPVKTQYPLCRRPGGLQGRSGRVRKMSPTTGIRSPDRPVISKWLHVIFIAFSLQQWLHERSSLLCYTYIAYLVTGNRTMGRSVKATIEWVQDFTQRTSLITHRKCRAPAQLDTSQCLVDSRATWLRRLPTASHSGSLSSMPR